MIIRKNTVFIYFIFFNLSIFIYLFIYLFFFFFFISNGWRFKQATRPILLVSLVMICSLIYLPLWWRIKTLSGGDWEGR